MINQVPVDDNTCFVGPMNVTETYTKLKSDGDFIVRIDPQKGNYVLSLYCSSDIRHFEILHNQSGKFYLEKTRVFDTPFNLVRSYRCDKGVLPTDLRTPQGTNKLFYNGRVHTALTIQGFELVTIKEIGIGGYGTVCQGLWRNVMNVAIKEMREGNFSVQDFKREAKIMATLNHPNVVKIYGIETRHSDIRMVLEYMKDECLIKFLILNEERLKFNKGFLVSAVTQIARGMEYISTRGYVHRDLAARNCLVNGHVIKVADFGMTRRLKQGHYRGNFWESTPFRISPPEVIREYLYSTKSDVWSFGVLMWVICTFGKTPYDVFPFDCLVQDYVLKGGILPRPKNCDDKFYKLMTACWAYKPSQRPLFSSIEASL